MRRLLPPAALVVLSLLGSESPKEYDDATEVDGLEGTWQMEGNVNNVATYHGGHWTIVAPGLSWEGTYRTVTARRPHRLERFYANGPYQGRTLRYIYQIDGDVLKVATTRDESRAPQTFDDPGIRVYTFRRVK